MTGQMHYNDVPRHIDYPDLSMLEAVEATAKKHPDITALEYMGVKITFKQLIKKIEDCAESLTAKSITAGDRVTLCMPNCPEAVIMFYALNKLGAVANMVHPLAGENEIAYYVNFSRSKALLIPDMFYHKIEGVKEKLNCELIIVTSMAESLPFLMRTAYRLSNIGKIKRPDYSSRVMPWKSFLKEKKPSKTVSGSDHLAAILYSGGTTGTAKGVMLTSQNFNACAFGTAAAGNCIETGNKMVAILPVFHGFGMGICIHTALICGCTSILVPRFSLKDFDRLLRKSRPNYIAGVPTLFEAMTRMENTDTLDLSPLKGVFCGGDSLSPQLKERVDSFLKAHGSTEQIREGYGLTECVAASCLTPRYSYKKGSVGVPFPDTLYKIVSVETNEELPCNTDGEILISGPSVMQGYLDNREETDKALEKDEEGRTWLHTGDIGSIDEEGFVYFKQRLKRIIITSGFNVYPSQVENVINSLDKVKTCAVIGIQDDYKMQRVKAFVILKEGVTPDSSLTDELIAHCKRNMARYAVPKEIEYRESLPQTKLGKIAYRELEQEEKEKKNGNC